MHAVVLTHPSLDAFTPTDLPTPSSPGHGQIHVGMRAASLNYIDIDRPWLRAPLELGANCAFPLPKINVACTPVTVQSTAVCRQLRSHRNPATRQSYWNIGGTPVPRQT